MTYDQLLAQGERLIEMLSTTSEVKEDVEELEIFDEDIDIPF